MNNLHLRWSAIVFSIGLFTVLSSGCVVPGGGYGYGGGVGIGYYEPYGIDYGGWGPGYGVAPYRGGDIRSVRVSGNPSSHAYRSAPASHSMPSIPSRSGGQRGGGGGGSRSR